MFCRDDPRFPTVRGVMRRGMTVEGLKEFVIAQVWRSLFFIKVCDKFLVIRKSFFLESLMRNSPGVKVSS